MALSAAALGLTACGNGDDTPIVGPPVVIKGGTTVVSLATAPAGVSAIRVRVVGSGVSLPSARGTATLLSHRAVGDTNTFLVATSGVAAGDAMFAMQLANATTTLSVTVEEATGGRAQGYAAIAPASVTVSAVTQ